MHSDGYVFMSDNITKFFNTVRVAGWLHHPTDRLAAVALTGGDILAQVTEVGLPHGTDPVAGENRGFVVHALCRRPTFDQTLCLQLTTQAGWSKAVMLSELAADRDSIRPSVRFLPLFRQALEKMNRPKVLDIGGGNRSGFDLGQAFPGIDYKVLDILPGDNVDVVGDAHKLSAIFPRNHFDAIITISVFEHLLMPWKVAVEMNKVMKPGAIALVQSHQTVGMHYIPWDFFRFSDTAWDALFNKGTGFEITNRALDKEQYIVPMIYSEENADAEKTAGFNVSIIMARKIGDSVVDWNIALEEVIDTTFPGAPEASRRLASQTQLEQWREKDRFVSAGYAGRASC